MEKLFDRLLDPRCANVLLLLDSRGEISRHPGEGVLPLLREKPQLLNWNILSWWYKPWMLPLLRENPELLN